MVVEPLPAREDVRMLTDGQVLLRRWTAADAAWYARQSADPQIQAFTCDPPGLTADLVAEAIARSGRDPSAEAFLVADAVFGEPLGNIAAAIDGAVADVSYWVAAAARRRGVASRALTLLSDWLAASGRVTELRLWTDADNSASQAVALRCGFVRDPASEKPREIKGQLRQVIAFRRPC